MKNKRTEGMAGVIIMMVIAIGGLALFFSGAHMFAGVIILTIAGIFGIVMALIGLEPNWKWLRRVCVRVRAYHAKWQREWREETIRHLNSLPPEERQRELAELAKSQDEDSFLHPNNLPYDRVKPDSFD